jgi:hypothetical protein
MAEIVSIAPEDETPEGDFAIFVERESEAHHQVVEFDRHHARFVYGPRSFASREDATRSACHWADQYGIPKVYVH